MDEPKVFDIAAKSLATPASRPVISAGPPAPDPMVKPPTKVAVSFADDPEPAQPKVENAPAQLDQPQPAAPVAEEAFDKPPVNETAPAPEPPTEMPAEAAPVTPEISNIEVNEPPAQPPVAEAAPLAEASGTITPALPGAPAPDFTNVPKFGELQPKIDAHPLFSGRSEHRVKVRRVPRFVWPLVILLIIIVALYLAVDDGIIRGYSHLPFHILKQKAAASDTPVITPSQTQTSTNSSTNSAPTTTDPYASWKIYEDNFVSFKYPTTWSVSNVNEKSQGFIGLTGPSDSGIALVDPATKQVSKDYSQQHLGAQINFVPSSSAAKRACATDGSNSCLVYDATAINIGSLSPKLVIYDNGNLGYPNLLTISDDPAALFNAKTFKNGFMNSGKLAIMSADVEYLKTAQDKSFSLNGLIANINDFKNSQSYQDLTKIFESVSIK